MSLYKSEYLRNLSSRYTINENFTQRLSSRYDSEFDIFLSHSFLDREEVKGLYIELTNMGYSVYVDWIIDSHLDRNNVTKQTAELIKNRLKSSKTLLLAISTNSELSKWMPWELGYVDGNTDKCAIIPISRDNRDLEYFQRREYLLLYPFVKKRKNMRNEEKLWIIEDSDVYVVFEEWKEGLKPYKRDSLIF